ncbi:MAG: glycoside hydrolase family 38 C-terminal domain-containing protein [Dysgonomonas sp.]
MASFLGVSLFSKSQEKSLHFISTSHLDTQWNWDVKTTINEYIPNTMLQNFALLEKYPTFQFNFEAAIHYKWMKEYYPDQYNKLKQYVQDQRWHLSGGSINASDVMVPSGESIIRNFLYGQTFYKKEFGRKGGTDFMVPDCFGFPYSLPSLAKHCGVTGFHTAKLAWGSAYKYDDLAPFGIWKGVDGSEIYAIFKGEPYDWHEVYNKDMSYDSDILNAATTNQSNYGAPFVFRYVGPRGDRGGALQDNAQVTGENTPYWLQTSVNSDGPLKVHLSTPSEIFSLLDQYKNDKYFVWNNELPMTKHGVGCYTSHAMMKYWNRKNELLADAAEKSSVFASWIGGINYPSDQMRDAWTTLLWHHFHDDLTGTSIPSAYTYSYNDEVLVNLNLSEVLKNSIGSVARKMDTQTAGIPLVVYNPLSIERKDVVEATVSVDAKVDNIRVFDKNGTEVLSQVLRYDASTQKLYIIFEATVPSLGYSVYDLRLNEASSLGSDLSISGQTIENNNYKIEIDTNGDVSSVLDKGMGISLLSSPIRLAMLNDVSTEYPSWEIMWDDVNAAPKAYVDENVSISIEENGPLRVSLKISRTKNGSKFVQYVRLMPAGVSGRIDFVNEVDWRSRGTLLKAEFPLRATNSTATYDLSLGAIERGVNKSNLYEVAGHQWADQMHSSGLYGVSILNDCKYGWDKPSNSMLRLTLIHTPSVGSGYVYQKDQDLGYNKFSYSFYSHLAGWNEKTQWEASRLNQPMLAFRAPKHEGSLGKSVDFVSINTDKVAIKALKKAEESDEIVVRVYELVGESHQNVKITFPSNVIAAREINGIEEEVGPVSFEGGSLSFDIDKFQPKSFAVKLSDTDAQNEIQTPNSEMLDLDYNIDVMSLDSRKNNATSGVAYAYPAELLSDTIYSDNIGFKIGGRSNGSKNAVSCASQEITLPAVQNAKKIYILAGSKTKTGTKANFTLDGVNHTFNIPYYAGNVGEWETEYNLGTSFRKENVAFTATHRHNVSDNKNDAYDYMYMYKYCIPFNGTASKLVLPDNPDLYVFAVTMSDNENDDATAASEIGSLPEDTTFSDQESTCATRLLPASVYASHDNGASENADKALDLDLDTKWCVTNNNTPYLELTFNEPVDICRWSVLNAGAENFNYITKSFRLQYYVNNMWIDADVVADNTENKVIRQITPIKTQKVRLQINKGEQNGNVTRILEFAVYGENGNSSIADDKIYGSDVLNVEVFPNPVKTISTFRCRIAENVPMVKLGIYNLLGSLVDLKEYSVDSSKGSFEFSWDSTVLNEGIYLYKIMAYGDNRIITSGINKLIVKR